MALAIPEGVWVLSGVSRLVGVEDPARILQEFQQLIDTDELRRVGVEVWGATAADSPVSGVLEQTGDRLVDEFLRTVEDRWQGQAYQGFESYLTEVRAALRQEADSLPVIGATLIAVADAIELTWLEMIGAALTAVSLIMAVETVLSAAGFVMALLGIIIAGASSIVTMLSIARPRMEMLGRHEIAFDRYGRNAASPIFSVPSIDARGTGWTSKTTDPYS